MNYKLKDLLDIPRLQSLLDALDEIHSLPSAIIDTEGNILTATAWQDICVKFHRANPKAEKKCIESDSYIAKELEKYTSQVVYKCPFGLIDTATPIIVEGRHLGNVFTGQLFVEPPDKERFIRQAREYGFVEKDYIEALRKVPIISEERLRKNLVFLARFTEMLATQGLQSKRQRKAEEALRLANQLNELAIRSTQEGLIIYGPDLRYQTWNPYMERLTGLEASEVLGKSPLDVFPFLREAGVLENLEKALTGEIPDPVDFRYALPNGESVWATDSCAPLKNEKGEIVGVLGIVRDITERKKAVDTLQESERRYRDMFEANPHAMCVYDVETLRFLSVNDAMISRYGYSREEFLSMTIADIRPAQDLPHLQEALIQAAKSQSINISSARHRKKDGTIIDVEVTSHALDFEGRRARMITAYDTTERTRAARALQKSEASLKKAEQIALVGSWNWNILTNELEWSDQVYRLYGLDPQKDRPSYDIVVRTVAPEHQERFISAVENAVKHGKPFSGEYRMIGLDGTVRYTYTTGEVIRDQTGRPVSMFGIVQDITARRKAEEALIAAKEFAERLIETANAIVIGLDTSGKVSVFNRAAETITGYTREEMRSRNWFEVMVPKDRYPHVWDEFKRITSGGIPKNFENSILTKNGEERYIVWQNNELYEQGKVVGTISFGVDITERKMAEAALLKSESRLREAQKIGRIGNWELDVGSGNLWWSDEVYELFGLKKGSKLTLERFLQRVHPDDRQRVSDIIMNSIAKKSSNWQFEYRIILDSGEVRFMYENAAADLDASDRVVIRRGIVQDVTEQKLTEAALHENVEQFRALVEQSLTGVVLIQDGKFVYVNPRLAAMVGYTQEEMLGRSPMDLVVTEDQDLVREKMRQRLSGEKDSVNYTFRARHKNGTEVVMELYGRTTTYQGKRTLLSTMLDITERKKAEETVLKLSQAVEQSPVSIVITDVKGNIEFINPRFTQVTGYEAADVLGKNPRILKSGETPPERYKNLWETIAGGRAWEGDLHNRKKNGELFWEHASISPIRDRAGTITHYLGIKEDITERKKLEEQLSQSQKMEAIGQLAGGVAHDFNNILSTITGYASLLEMAAPSDSTQREYVAEISVAAERGANLTQSLLSFSRKQDALLTAVDLNEQLRSLHKVLTRLVGEDIDLVLDLDREDIILEADTGQLQQVLMNLASNARDAMPNGGTLRIATRTDTVGSDRLELSALEQPGKYAVLSIADTGAGMDQSVRERIFEPFYTTKGVGKGTGLGLSIVYGIIKKHRGSITVDSAPGKGTVFSIYLPLTEKSVRGHSAENARSLAAAGNKTILLVEDEEAVRRVLRLTLKAYGYRVIEACDGEEAVQVFRKNRNEVQLVLCDLVMPKKNGRQACEEMQKIRPDVRTIFMSGYTKDIFDQKGIMESDIALLVKPINPKDLVKKISEVLEETHRPS